MLQRKYNRERSYGRGIEQMCGMRNVDRKRPCSTPRNRWMGNIIYLNFGGNVSQNKLDLGETRQGKMVGFRKHDYKPIPRKQANLMSTDNEKLYLPISVDYLLSNTVPNAELSQDGKLRKVHTCNNHVAPPSLGLILSTAIRLEVYRT